MSTCQSISKHNNDYQREIEWLFQQFPSYQNIGAKAFKPTLANSRAICEFLGNPERQLKFIHVAGSNGKGSTSSMLASILTEAGYKVGLFTSPHIKDFRERIRINGIQITEEKVIEFIQKIKQATLSFEPSFFEITFGLALEYFNEEKCDYCVIETGLGGRLDATNIITPLLSIITNISLEHTAILGDTLEEIAVEKAGIIKENIPVVAGETAPHLYPIFERIAKERNARMIRSISVADIDNFKTPLLGYYQLENLRTVLCSCQLLAEQGIHLNPTIIQKGLDNLFTNSGFSGRLQIVSESPLTIFDVSHNPAGIEASFLTISSLNKGQLHIVYGTSGDKDVDSILEVLPKHANYYFTAFKSERSIRLEDLTSTTQSFNPISKTFFSDPHLALKSAQNNANHADTIVVIGSFFLISDFF